LFSYAFKIFDFNKAHRVVFLCAEGIKAAHTACAAFPCMLCYAPHRIKAAHTKEGKTPLAAFSCIMSFWPLLRIEKSIAYKGRLRKQYAQLLSLLRIGKQLYEPC